MADFSGETVTYPTNIVQGHLVSSEVQQYYFAPPTTTVTVAVSTRVVRDLTRFKKTYSYSRQQPRQG